MGQLLNVDFRDRLALDRRRQQVHVAERQGGALDLMCLQRKTMFGGARYQRATRSPMCEQCCRAVWLQLDAAGAWLGKEAAVSVVKHQHVVGYEPMSSLNESCGKRRFAEPTVTEKTHREVVYVEHSGMQLLQALGDECKREDLAEKKVLQSQRISAFKWASNDSFPIRFDAELV
ncbi:MAG: hypothetical protein DMF89_27050 [Acidobacteria bacterium]|nr:MAG: hypothetical protein DMF89_27050 [Acidobacteriota bacterium]